MIGAASQRRRPVARRGQGAGSAADRVLVTLVLLAVAIAATGVFLVSSRLLSAQQLLPYYGLQQQLLGWIERLSGLQRIGVAGGALAVGVIALAWLLRGFSRERSSAGRHVLSADERGFVIVDAAGVASVAEAAALRAQGVLDAVARVRGAGAAPIHLSLLVAVHHGTNIREAGEAVRQRATEAVEQLVGLKVRETVVQVDVLSLDQLDRYVA